MNRFQDFFALRRFTSSDPEVMISQIHAFSKQVPLLYIVGNANSFALAYTHYQAAPKLLTLIVPIPMLIVCLIRMVVWHRSRFQTFTPATARARLRATIVITGLLGLIYAGWALSLYPYGDAYARCHVAFFMATTVTGTIFCLMHLRAAAMMLTVVVTIPFLCRFLTTGEPALTAMAINFLMVIIIMTYIVSLYNKYFTDLIQSQKISAALGDENFRIANQDSLTGLPNRRSFFADLTTILDNPADDDVGFAVGLIDLDGFKPVNDVFGHAAGDRVLVEIGRRLRDLLGTQARVARLGGDEFGLLLPIAPGSPDLSSLGAAICNEVQRPIQIEGNIARVAASVGFALRSERALTWKALLERADYALYAAKAQRGTSVLFSAQHEKAIRTKSALEQELRRANFETEMSLKFQPIVHLGKQTTAAYEALARWKSPLLGDVSPLDFIAAAERMGLINQLTEVLFAKALTAMDTWPTDIDLSFNLSVRDLACPESMARIKTMIARSRIKPKRIIFEVTESALVHDFEQTRDVLLSLKEMGAKIALDDFGTGFSSLSYVHRLPFDKIKVDRSFVRDITTNQASQDIVKSIIDLCRNLRVTCVVEGVETQGQVLVLRLLGCTTVQGYFFGRPADNADLPSNLSVEVVNPTQAKGRADRKMELTLASTHRTALR